MLESLETASLGILFFQRENIPFFLSKDMVQIPIIHSTFSTVEKILSFKKLPNGWYYGEGKAPDNNTIEKALAWNNLLFEHGFMETGAFPGADNEITITGYWPNHCVEIIIENDGNYTLIHEVDGKEIGSYDNVNENEAKNALKEIVERIWNILGYSIHANSIPSPSDFVAIPSRTQARSAVQGFPSYALNALRTPATPSVHTPENITYPLPGNLQFFGNSTNPSFLPDIR